MIWAEPTRRDFLYGLGATLGTAALSSLVHGQDALAPKPPHRSPRAKACIYLFMEGGPSHIDTFDPKPKLASLHMKEFQRQDRFASAMASGKRYFVQSPFSFVRAGDAGIAMNSGFAQLAKVADELCIYRGLQAESIDHPTACYHMNTGNRFGGDPAIGAWVTYGLGSPNRNLPSFVVLPEVNFPQGGAANWSNGFLPAYFQGTALRAQGSPILDLRPPEGVTPEHQRKNLDLLAELNRGDARRNPHHQDPLARTASYELAFRMQMEVPAVLDLSKEDPKLLERYGIGREPTDSFGRRCLLARRLVEQGVPFVQVYAGGWDSHDYIATAHKNRIETVDRPMAALISDLKQRGLLDETLVAWGGEFGRSPDNGVRGGIAYGRDHNPTAMTIWLAGGGVNAGHTIGATDELGMTAVEEVHHVRDLHVTLLRLLGLDDNKLTYYHAGRFKQLSQFGGKVIEGLIG
jgi:uncharacterized protein DUF1501